MPESPGVSLPGDSAPGCTLAPCFATARALLLSALRHSDHTLDVECSRLKQQQQEQQQQQEKEEEEEEEERADRNRSPSTIARTGPFCCSRAWEPLTPTKESCPKESTGLNLMKNALRQQRHLQRIVRTVEQRFQYHFRIQVARPNVLAKPKMTSPTDFTGDVCFSGRNTWFDSGHMFCDSTSVAMDELHTFSTLRRTLIGNLERTNPA